MSKTQEGKFQFFIAIWRILPRGLNKDHVLNKCFQAQEKYGELNMQ